MNRNEVIAKVYEDARGKRPSQLMTEERFIVRHLIDEFAAKYGVPDHMREYMYDIAKSVDEGLFTDFLVKDRGWEGILRRKTKEESERDKNTLYEKAKAYGYAHGTPACLAIVSFGMLGYFLKNLDSLPESGSELDYLKRCCAENRERFDNDYDATGELIQIGSTNTQFCKMLGQVLKDREISFTETLGSVHFRLDVRHFAEDVNDYIARRHGVRVLNRYGDTSQNEIQHDKEAQKAYTEKCDRAVSEIGDYSNWIRNSLLPYSEIVKIDIVKMGMLPRFLRETVEDFPNIKTELYGIEKKYNVQFRL